MPCFSLTCPLLTSPNKQISSNLGGLNFMVSLIKNWDYSLFYIMSELFGSVGVSVLFWQLANEIIKVDEAKVRLPACLLVLRMRKQQRFSSYPTAVGASCVAQLLITPWLRSDRLLMTTVLPLIVPSCRGSTRSSGSWPTWRPSPPARPWCCRHT